MQYAAPVVRTTEFLVAHDAYLRNPGAATERRLRRLFRGWCISRGVMCCPLRYAVEKAEEELRTGRHFRGNPY